MRGSWNGLVPCRKRENIRYEADYMLTEEDILAEGRFDDMIAHGGWTMDDHPPAGIFHPGKDTTHHPAPSPYGIPYRSLYSRNVRNLWCAGRNIGCTHMAMSSTRVMATCATLGLLPARRPRLPCNTSAITAPSISIIYSACSAVYSTRINGCRVARGQSPSLTQQATLSASAGDPAPLLDGVDRVTNGVAHAWTAQAGDWIQFSFTSPQDIHRLRLIADSKLSKRKVMPCTYPLSGVRQTLPSCLVRNLRIESSDDGTTWQPQATITNNYRRFIEWRPDQPLQARYLRVIFDHGWSDTEPMAFFAAEVGAPDEDGPIDAGPWPKKFHFEWQSSRGLIAMTSFNPETDAAVSIRVIEAEAGLWLATVPADFPGGSITWQTPLCDVAGRWQPSGGADRNLPISWERVRNLQRSDAGTWAPRHGLGLGH